MRSSPPRKRKSPPRKDKDSTTSRKALKQEADTNPKATETTTLRPRTESLRTPPGRGQGGRPPTRQQQRTITRSRSTDVSPIRAPIVDRGRLPQIGVGEASDPAHIRGIRNTWDARALFDLWNGLADEDTPRRWDLIKTVEMQLIRAQLRGMMGGKIATRANIQVDGEIDMVTQTRDVTQRIRPGAPMGDDEGTREERAVWNSSREDAEVDTIRDIYVWADKQTVDSLRGRKQVIIQIPGTSGPCDACKKRLRDMADSILDDWERMGVSRDKLPQLQIESYYGNPTREFQRQGYWSRNGWVGDPTPPALDFTNRNGQDQLVRTHMVYQSRPPVDTDSESDSERSEDVLVPSKQ